MAKSLSTVAARRIQSELKDWGHNPPEGCLLESCEPMTQWVVLMQGPDGSRGMPRLYENELFRLQITFTDRYPLEPPERRPPGDHDYCSRVGNKSPKLTQWNFDDDKV